jgi:hypothetical protein
LEQNSKHSPGPPRVRDARQVYTSHHSFWRAGPKVSEKQNVTSREKNNLSTTAHPPPLTLFFCTILCSYQYYIILHIINFKYWYSMGQCERKFVVTILYFDLDYRFSIVERSARFGFRCGKMIHKKE